MWSLYKRAFRAENEHTNPGEMRRARLASKLRLGQPSSGRRAEQRAAEEANGAGAGIFCVRLAAEALAG